MECFYPLNENLGNKQNSSTAITTRNIGQQSVNYAASAGAVSWNGVSNKPSTYAPSSHDHDDRYYTETEVNNLLKNRIVLKAEKQVTTDEYGQFSLWDYNTVLNVNIKENTGTYIILQQNKNWFRLLDSSLNTISKRSINVIVYYTDE